MIPNLVVLSLLSGAPAGAAPCAEWSAPELLPPVGPSPIHEASGLAPSAADPELWFTVNDSGGEAIIYAFSTDGRYRGESPVAGAINRDWEELSPGPCIPGGGHCLFVADIGDNRRARKEVRLTMIPEPIPGAAVAPWAAWTLRYGDGQAHDAEALLVHPKSGDLLILSKEEDGRAGLWSVPPQPGDGALTRVGTLDLSARSNWQRRVTGAAWSSDGETVAIRTYGPILLFAVDPCGGAPWWDQRPSELRVGQLPQAEAIAFTADGSLLTISEGRPMPVARLRCERRAPAPADCRPVPR